MTFSIWKRSGFTQLQCSVRGCDAGLPSHHLAQCTTAPLSLHPGYSVKMAESGHCQRISVLVISRLAINFRSTSDLATRCRAGAMGRNTRYPAITHHHPPPCNLLRNFSIRPSSCDAMSLQQQQLATDCRCSAPRLPGVLS